MSVALWSRSGTIISTKGGPGDFPVEAAFELGLEDWGEFRQWKAGFEEKALKTFYPDE